MQVPIFITMSIYLIFCYLGFHKLCMAPSKYNPTLTLYVLSNLFILILSRRVFHVLYDLFTHYMSSWTTKILSYPTLKYTKNLLNNLHMWAYSHCYFYLLVIFHRVTKQETLHKHKDLDRTVEMVEGSTAQESTEPPKKSLLKNWPLMSSIITYCVFSLHDTAYVEVPSTLLIRSATLKYNGSEIYLLQFDIRYFLYGL